MSVIGKEAIKPARLDLIIIEKGVLNIKKAMIEMNNHPIKPAESAAKRFQRSKINMSIIGERAMR